MGRNGLGPGLALLIVTCLAAVGPLPAAAQPAGRGPGNRGGRVHLWFDLGDRGHERVEFPAAGEAGIPGVVAVNKKPYRCDLHRQDFATEEAFASHLRVEHKLPYRNLGQVLEREEGQVHFRGGS